MKVFCPNCGTDNEGMPGGRLTCKACTASFEVPREGGASPAPVSYPPPAPPPPVMTAPPPSNAPFPSGYVGPPPSGFGNQSGSLASGETNSLAIISMVLGILCCIPFASIAAIVTGVIAQNQINATNGQQRGKEFALVGIILGSVGILLGILGALSSILGRLH